RNEVIANLDAGKLVAGSAFTNALSVKTNFTLGDASTNGGIQTYDFAGSAQGVYIDKFGLVARGGTITGSTLQGTTVNGGTLRGGTVETSGTGYRAAMETGAGGFGGRFAIYNDSSLIGQIFGGFDVVPFLHIGAGAGTTDPRI